MRATLGAMAGVLFGLFVGLTFVVSTSYWVGTDHRAMDREYGRSGETSTTFWVVGCLLVWIVVFPCYLVYRSKRQTAFYGRGSTGPTMGAATSGTVFCGSCGTRASGV